MTISKKSFSAREGIAASYFVQTKSHQECRFWGTNSSSPGATKISCFLERRRRKVRSFWGSISRIVLLAFMVRLRRSPAYCTAVELSRVVLMGIPGNVNECYQLDTNAIVMCHLCHHLPSALTTIVPITPFFPSILFSVSSTSAFGTPPPPPPTKHSNYLNQ